MSKLRLSELNFLLALFVLVAGTWAFLELADEVREGETLSYDNQILISLRSPDNLGDPIGPMWLESAMRDITALGSQVVLFLLVAAVAGFLILVRRHRQLILILLTSLSGVLMVVILKYLFFRQRPDVVPHLVDVSSESYPSGHSMMAAVIYLSLAAMLAPVLKRRSVRIYIIAVALVVTVLVGLSRIYMGVHYPTDVLSGWAVGLAWAALSWLLFRYLNVRKTFKSEREKTYDSA